MNKMTNQKSVALFSGPMAVLALGLVAMSLFGANNLGFSPTSIQAAPKVQTKLTPTLVAWISSQSEGIVQEMEAIVKHQVEAQQFSVVLYLRYLNLYDKLKVVAAKEHVDKFAWVARKVKAYGIVYRSVYNMVEVFLRSLDSKMSSIEANEKRGKQVDVTKEWVTIYETINYIATHAPKGSSLATEATEQLAKSPSGTPDKKRSTRYVLFRRVFH